MIDKKLALLILASSITAQPALGQRQLLCEPGEACSVTCYQAGLDEATTVFSRDQLETLQVDLNARVLKMDFRDEPEQRNSGERHNYDYFILGSDMSCTINNMHGVHD